MPFIYYLLVNKNLKKSLSVLYPAVFPPNNYLHALMQKNSVVLNIIFIAFFEKSAILQP
ncbi:MAG: hypothetical protein ACJA0G_001420 [Kangiellaceae bacterium]|jgi:hypothetical protein